MDVTITIDEKILARAQEIARRRCISLDQMVAGWLEELTTVPEHTPEETIQELEELWAMNSGTSEPVQWTREEIHERGRIR